MAKSDQVRIIGGRFRGRKLSFVPQDGVRPTPDRVRETLFNWLQPVMAGARCLDAFAGSGVLGLEALSRGAEHVVFVDASKAVVQRIHAHLVAMGMQEQAQTVLASMPHIALTASFDLVFLDPPYQDKLLAPCLDWLIKHQALRPNALVYTECADAPDAMQWPAPWSVYRHMRAGKVHAYLLHIPVV